MIRALVLAVALVVLAAPFAHSQDGYAGGWTDPVPTGSRDDKPLLYLERTQALVGEVSHPNGIASVSVLLVPDPDNPPPDGCGGSVDDVAVEPNGTMALFHVTTTFPCNTVYELRATAQANDSGGVGQTTPPAYAMPVMVAVALPPESVRRLDAALKVEGDTRTVTLDWPAGDEPDLLGYVVTRVTGDDVDTLGQVDAGDETQWVDDDPPVGQTSRYEVTAIRNGPDDEVSQVAADPTVVDVEVPADEPEPQPTEGATTDDTAGEPDPQLAGDPEPAESQGRPDPGLLSSVNSRGPRPRPSPPTTIDTGFSGTIDYPEGEEVAAPPAPIGDAAVVAEFDETTTGSPWSDEETMTFVAGGLAVLIGAAHVMTVTRRAARAAY